MAAESQSKMNSNKESDTSPRSKSEMSQSTIRRVEVVHYVESTQKHLEAPRTLSFLSGSFISKLAPPLVIPLFLFLFYCV